MGWTPSSNVLTVRGSGLYKITSLETNPASAFQPQVIKVLKQDTGDYYYLSMREPVGLFGQRFISSSFAYRLSVHRIDSLSRLLGSRGLNEPYDDSINGISITPIAINGSEMTLDIKVNDTCVRSAPTLSLYQPSAVLPGAATSTYVYIQNNDSFYCENSIFNVSASGTSDITATPSVLQLNIAPGSSQSFNVSIQTQLTTVVGNYSIQTSAVDSADASRAASGVISLTVGSSTKGNGRGRKNR
jgi:hypothetical protein